MHLSQCNKGLTIPCPKKIYTIYHANDGMTIIAKLPKMWSAVIKQPIISKKNINAETLGENITRSYSKQRLANNAIIHIANKHQHYSATRIMPLEQHRLISSVQKYKHINQLTTTKNKCMHTHEPFFSKFTTVF